MKQTSTKVGFALAMFFLSFSNYLNAQTTPGEVRISVINSLAVSICDGDTPNPFLETVPPTSTTNASFQYQWMQSPINTTPGMNSPGWELIDGAVAKDYAPPALATSTYFSRCARPNTGDPNEPWVESNPIYIEVESLPAPPSFTINGGTPGNPGIVVQNQPATFNIQTPGANLDFEWDFDMDGDVDCIGQNCFNVYTAAGMAETMVMAVSATGCMNSSTESFMVDVALPVELTLFEGRVSDNQQSVSLSWATASESNSSHFIVEKSSEGSRFEALGVVESYGDGNSNHTQSYSFIDENPSNGLNYYRLKQVDLDGNFEYFKIISVQMEEIKGTFIFPNPAKYKLTVQTDLELNNGGIIEITDTYGQVVQQSVVSGNRINNIEIGVHKLKGGVYHLSILSGKENLFTQRIIIIN